MCERCRTIEMFRNSLQVLNNTHQRVTYEAYALALRTDRRSPLRGHSTDPFHSWVVDSSGFPSGYSPSQWHKDLQEKPVVLTDPEKVRELFVSNGVRVPD